MPQSVVQGLAGVRTGLRMRYQRPGQRWLAGLPNDLMPFYEDAKLPVQPHDIMSYEAAFTWGRSRAAAWWMLHWQGGPNS